MIFKNDNDYSCTVYFPDGTHKSMAYVHNVYKFSLWVLKTWGDFSVIYVYNRRSSKFICKYLKGQYIHQKPQ